MAEKSQAIAIAIAFLVGITLVVGFFLELIAGVVIIASVGIMGLAVWIRKSTDTARERRNVAITVGVILFALIVIIAVLLFTRTFTFSL
jgi:hypothetical protein